MLENDVGQKSSVQLYVLQLHFTTAFFFLGLYEREFFFWTALLKSE